VRQEVPDHIKDFAELKKYFINPKTEHKPITYFPLDGDIADSEFISTRIAGYKKAGFGGVVLGPTALTRPEYCSDEYFAALQALIDKCKKSGLSVSLCDDTDSDEHHMSGRGGGKFTALHPEYCAKQLKIYEYMCSVNEHLNRPVRSPGTLMSVCAYEIDEMRTLDLREFVREGRIIWDVPEGNWNLLQFICEDDPSVGCVDYLSYDASLCFLRYTFKRLTDENEDNSDAFLMTVSSGIAYLTTNRRQWNPDFNKVFTDELGCEAEPLYPALFLDIGSATARSTALLINCRSKMLVNGFFRALSDFTRSRGITATGCVAEPKATAAPWLFGDGMLYQKYLGAPGTTLSSAYAYGVNGLKLASSAACCWDRETVTCDIFRDYYLMGKNILYSDAMNALVRGINCLTVRDHVFGTVKLGEVLPAWSEFISRAQTLLRGGRHVCDIALLYPIYSLQSQVKLYDAKPDSDFEYPTTPVNADYMNIINALLNYCGRDVTVIHPEVFDHACYAEDGVLYMHNDNNNEQFRVLILPGASMADLRSMRIAKKFYDGGGKIVATDDLPFTAFISPDEGKASDAELAEINHHIFGVKKNDIGSFTQVFANKNEAGGMAYFIQLSQTAADGTDLISAPQLDAVLDKFGVDWDVTVNDMPRVENSGILNVFYPAFEALRANRGIRSGGMFNYLHRRYAGCEIWYFANTTTADYEGMVTLRGRYSPEEWNPHTGKCRKLTCECDGDHTSAKLVLPNKTSVFWVSAAK
jgi:hypothetical protein